MNRYKIDYTIEIAVVLVIVISLILGLIALISNIRDVSYVTPSSYEESMESEQEFIFSSDEKPDESEEDIYDVVESSVEVCSSYVKEPIYDESVYEETDDEEIDLYYDVPLSDELQDYIFEVCEDYGVNHLVVLAMIKKESAFNSASIGDNGNSLGLMQIQPRWHQERMNKLGVTDLLDPYQNVLVGVDYLADMMAYGKGIEWSLMAYNGGPTYANQKAAAGEVNKYTTSVLEYAMNFERR